MVVIAVLVASTSIHAAPKGAAAKTAFDRGVAAYTKKDWPAAATALQKSYELEPDIETLFAWAQAERQQDHCEKAIELYAKLLEGKLPDANRKVILAKSDECKKLVAAKQPEPTSAPKPEPQPEIKPAPEPVIPIDPIVEPRPSGRSAWWKDPIGDGLVGLGLVGLGAGGYFLVSASKASSDAKAATNYFEAERLNDKADSQGKTGVIASVVGGALVVGGIVRYVTRGGGGKRETKGVTGWLAPDGGGITAFGRF